MNINSLILLSAAYNKKMSIYNFAEKNSKNNFVAAIKQKEKNKKNKRKRIKRS